MLTPAQTAFAVTSVTKVSTEDLTVTLDFTRLLKAGELLDVAHVPTVDILTGQTDLVCGPAAVNAAPVSDDYGNPIAAGLAVQFEITGGTPPAAPSKLANLYQLRVSA